MAAAICAVSNVPLAAELLEGVENERLASVHFNWALLADAAFSAIQKERSDVVRDVLKPVCQLAAEIRDDSNLDSDVQELCAKLGGALDVPDLPLALYILGQTREAVVHLQGAFSKLPADRRWATIDRITAVLSLRAM